MSTLSRLKARASAKRAANPTGAAAAAALAMGELTPSERQTVAAAAAKLPGRTDLPRLSDVVEPRKSGNLGGYYLGPKRGRGTLGGYYQGPLTKAQRNADPLPPVEVKLTGATAQIPQDPAHPVSSPKPKNPKTMSDEKTTAETKTETVPAHDTKVETKTEETRHQPETKVETKTEKTEPAK